MDTLLEDYKTYYKVRAKRYKNSPLYPHSYASETALSDAMDSCSELIEFKDKIGDLNIKNAIALVKDQETARLKHYKDLKEPIRALAPEKILGRIDEASNENDVVKIVNEIEQEVSVAITLDGFTDAVYSDLIPMVINREILQKAVVPEKYKVEMEENARELEVKIRDRFAEVNVEGQQWSPSWKLDLDLVWEDRHRRKIPLPDAVLEAYLSTIKTICHAS
jgi:hypothetical protein